MTEKSLPKPPIEAGVDLRDFRFMPLDVIQLANSETWMLACAVPFAAGACVNLWCRAWHQVPAGSLPDNETILRAWAAVPNWDEIRDIAMRGFTKCSDGRLYHFIIADKANEAWRDKISYREFRETQREKGQKGASKRWSEKGKSKNSRRHGSGHAKTDSQAMAPAMAAAMPNAIAERWPKGTGTGKGKGTPPPTPSRGDDEVDFMTVAEEAFRRAGIHPDEQRDLGSADRLTVKAWLNAGAIPERHVYPVIDAWMEERDRSGKEPPDSLRYFAKGVAAAIESVPATARTNGAAAEPEYLTFEQRQRNLWMARLFAFCLDGARPNRWPPEFGKPCPTDAAGEFRPDNGWLTRETFEAARAKADAERRNR